MTQPSLASCWRQPLAKSKWKPEDKKTWMYHPWKTTSGTHNKEKKDGKWPYRDTFALDSIRGAELYHPATSYGYTLKPMFEAAMGLKATV